MEKSAQLSSAVHKQLGIFVSAFILCSFGLTLTGDWLIITAAIGDKKASFLSNLHWDYNVLTDILVHVLWATVPAIIIYWVFCGFLHWKYYYMRRDHPEDWKCQPRKFLSWEDEKNEIFLGLLSLTIASALSGVLSWYITNGGHNTLYTDVSEYGWPYFLFTVLIHFWSTDFLLYWAHRTFHKPLLYRLIHKCHHRYKQPTAFSCSAMHPIEMLTYQSITIAPIFIIPIHWAELVFQLCYSFYYGVLDHSGIKFYSIWPWQPPTTFHDNHHQYFHCNYGFHTVYFDKLFGTIRKKDRVYNEDTFYGSGKPLNQATEEERLNHEYNILDD